MNEKNRVAWEYKHRYFIHPFPDLDMAEIGNDGWELVAISENDTRGGSFFYFKRPRLPVAMAAPISQEALTKPKKKKS